MTSNKSFFFLSEEAKSLELYANSTIFKEVFDNDFYNEANAIVKQYVIDNTPFCFKEHPILFAKIKLLLSFKLTIPYESIYLIGSAKTGFSIDPAHFGKHFSEESDLDFAIADPILFDNVSREVYQWIDDYSNNKIMPNGEKDKYYWDINAKLLPKNIQRGFIDERKIPRNSKYEISKRIGQLMFLIKANLSCFNYLNVRECSARIYKDEECFRSQTVINITHAMKSLRNK